MSENVGEVFIEAHADTSGLSAELRRAAAAAAEAAQIEVGTDLNDAQLVEQVQRAADLAERFANIEFEATLQSGRLRAEAAALQASQGGTINFDVRSLRGLAGAFTQIAKKAKIEVEGDFSRFRQELRTELGTRTFVVKPEVDLTRVRQQIDRIRAIRPPDIKLNAEVDNVAATEAVINSLAKDRTVEFHLNTDVSRARLNAQVDALRARLAANPIKLPVEVDVDRTVGVFERIRNTISRIFSREAGRSVFGDFFRNLTAGNLNPLRIALTGIQSLMSKVGVVAGFLAASFVLISTAVIVALPWIEAVAAVLAGMVLQAGAAAVALGAGLVTAIGSVGAAFAVAHVGIAGVGDALTALSKIWADQRAGIKPTDAELKNLRLTLRQLSPNAREFVNAIDQIHPALQRLQLHTQNTLFFRLGESIRRTAQADLPIFQKGFESIAQILNNAARAFLGWLRTARGQEVLRDIFIEISLSLQAISDAAGHIGNALIMLFEGARPNAQRFRDLIVDLSRKFEAWAKKVTTPGKNGKTPLEDFFDRAWRAANDLGSILNSLITIIGKFFMAFTDPRNKNADPLHQLAVNLKTFSDNLDPKKIRAFVDDAKKKFQELLHAIVFLATTIQSWSNTLEGWTNKLKDDGSLAEDVRLLGLIAGFIGNIFAVASGAQPIDWKTLFPPPPGWDQIMKFLFGPADQTAIGRWFHDNIEVPVITWGTTLWGRIQAAWNANTVGELFNALFGGRPDVAKWLDDNILNPIVEWFRTFWQRLVNLIRLTGGNAKNGGGSWFLGAPMTEQDCQRTFGPLFGCIPVLVEAAKARISQFARDIPPLFAPVVPGLEQWRGPIDDAIGSWFSGGPGYAQQSANGMVSPFSGLAGRVVAAAGPVAARIRSLFSGVVGFAQGIARGIVSAFNNLAGRIAGAAGPVAARIRGLFAGTVAYAQSVARGIVNAFRGLAGRIAGAAGNVASRIRSLFAGAVAAARAAASGIVSAFRGLGSAIARAIGPIHIPRPVIPTPRAPTIPDLGGGVSPAAVGGAFAMVNAARTPISQTSTPQRVEAVFRKGMGSTTTVTQNIMLPTGDPQAAAMAVANRLALVRTV